MARDRHSSRCRNSTKLRFPVWGPASLRRGETRRLSSALWLALSMLTINCVETVTRMGADSSSIHAGVSDSHLPHPILLIDRRDSPTVTGSAFVVLRRGELFLVTSQHVARSMGPHAALYYRGSERRPVAVDLLVLVGSKGRVDWVHNNGTHDRDLRAKLEARALAASLSEDVSVLKLAPPVKAREALEGSALSESDLIEDLWIPHTGEAVEVLQFDSAKGRERLSEVRVAGTCATSHLTQRFRMEDPASPDLSRGSTLFVVSAELPTGSSGAPVFLSANPSRRRCIGLVSSLLPNGFVGVVPSGIIRDTIAQASNRAERRRVDPLQPMAAYD